MLEQEIREAIIKDLKRDGLFYDTYVNSNPIVLDAYQRGIIRNEDIQGALHEVITNSGKEWYKLHLSNPQRYQPDHIDSEALAYIIDTGGITQENARKIKFCHGETPESFVKEKLPRGAETYLEEKRKMLLRQDKDCEDDSLGLTLGDIDQKYDSLLAYSDPHPACMH
jgi:hypothetical protein